MTGILFCLGLFCALACTATEANVIFTQTMTPAWLYKNAEIPAAALVDHNAKRLTLRSTGGLQRILTLPLPCVKMVPGDIIFRLQISLQKPTGDSDMYIGVGNKDGISAIAQVVDNRPFVNVLGTVNAAALSRTTAEASGSSHITRPFDEEIVFEYKPSESFASFYSGGEKVTGILSEGPDMSQDLYLTIAGDIIAGDTTGEQYKIQSIRVEIENI